MSRTVTHPRPRMKVYPHVQTTNYTGRFLPINQAKSTNSDCKTQVAVWQCLSRTSHTTQSVWVNNE